MNLLRAMQVFVRVAEAGSLSAAGRDLGLSQPAVSQQVSALEQHLNVQLVNRTTRQLSLTDAGARYHRKAQAILDAVQEAGESARGSVGLLRGPLRIHAPVGLGQTNIADAAVAFQQQHPDVMIELVLDDQYVDLTAQAVDVAIRLGALPSSGLIARRIGTLNRIVVASPAYLSKLGTPETTQELEEHLQVQFNGAPDGAEMPLIGPDGAILVPVKPAFLANNAFALKKALLAGLGIGGAQLPLIQHELQTGQLVRVMRQFAYAPLDVHVVYPPSRFIPARVRAFVAFLEESLSNIWDA